MELTGSGSVRAEERRLREHPCRPNASLRRGASQFQSIRWPVVARRWAGAHGRTRGVLWWRRHRRGGILTSVRTKPTLGCDVRPLPAPRAVSAVCGVSARRSCATSPEGLMVIVGSPPRPAQRTRRVAARRRRWDARCPEGALGVGREWRGRGGGRARTASTVAWSASPPPPCFLPPKVAVFRPESRRVESEALQPCRPTRATAQ